MRYQKYKQSIGRYSSTGVSDKEVIKGLGAILKDLTNMPLTRFLSALLYLLDFSASMRLVGMSSIIR